MSQLSEDQVIQIEAAKSASENKDLLKLALALKYINEHVDHHTWSNELDLFFLSHIQLGEIDLMEQYVNAGIDLEVRDWDGWTGLMYALLHQHSEIAHILLENGADLTCISSDKDEMTLLMLTTHFQDTTWFKKLYTLGAVVTPKLITLLADIGDKHLLKLALQQKVDVNTPDVKGITPLMYAVQREDLEMIQILLDKGANVDLRCGYNPPSTPLETAINMGNHGITDLLTKYRGGPVSI